MNTDGSRKKSAHPQNEGIVIVGYVVIAASALLGLAVGGIGGLFLFAAIGYFALGPAVVMMIGALKTIVEGKPKN